MNDFALLQRSPIAVDSRRGRAQWQATEAARRPLVLRIEDRQFEIMRRAYAQHGGLASADEVAHRLRLRSEQPISVLARWIVARKIVNLRWQSQTLIPLFQFDLQDMSLRSGAVNAIAELTGAFDDWELALWFVQANAWLHDAAPIDQIEEDEAAVLEAARADRFIARG